MKSSSSNAVQSMAQMCQLVCMAWPVHLKQQNCGGPENPPINNKPDGDGQGEKGKTGFKWRGGGGQESPLARPPTSTKKSSIANFDTHFKPNPPKKSVFQVKGELGGSQPKSHWRVTFIGQNKGFKRV